jgi:hypothetical protein
MARQTESEFEKLLIDIKGKHSKRLNAILLTMGSEDEEAFANNYFKILEFVKPKLQRKEIISEEIDQVITIEHVITKSEDLEIEGD